MITLSRQLASTFNWSQISHSSSQNYLWTHHKQFTLLRCGKAHTAWLREWRIYITLSVSVSPENRFVYKLTHVCALAIKPKNIDGNGNVCKSLEWNCLTMCFVWFVRMSLSLWHTKRNDDSHSCGLDGKRKISNRTTAVDTQWERHQLPIQSILSCVCASFFRCFMFAFVVPTTPKWWSI